MAPARGWCLWRLLLAVAILNGQSPVSTAAEFGVGRYRFPLDQPGNQYEDVKLELTGRMTASVRDVLVTLQFDSNYTSTMVLVPPIDVGEASPSWLLCGSANATSLEVKVNWKTGEGDKQKILVDVSKKDTRFSEEDDWIVKSAVWEHRRLTWPADGEAAAVYLSSRLPVDPAVACLTYQCDDEAALKTEQNCKTFTSATKFTFPDANQVKRLPSYLYVRLANVTDIKDNGKQVKPEVKRGSKHAINEWLSSLAEMKPPVGASKARTDGPAAQPRTPLFSPGKKSPPAGAFKSQISRQHGTKKSPPAGAESHTGTTHGAEDKPGAHIEVIKTDNSQQSASVSDSRNANVNIYNYHKPPASAAPLPSPKSEQEQEQEPEPEQEPQQEPSPSAADGAAPLGKSVSGVVSARRPRRLQFAATPRQSQGGPLTLEMNSNGILHSLLMLTPEPKMLSISSGNGGSVRIQLCPGQLPGGLLSVTVSTAAGSTVNFTGLLHQPDDQLSLAASEEVELSRNQSQIRQLNFPDYTSPVGLKVDTPRNTCLRVSVFSKMCSALAGRLKETVVHKYLSSGDYLPIANAFETSRRAFLRTEWASPERCGLPAVAAAGPLRALLSLGLHEDSDIWPIVLLPPLTLALALPALFGWLMRTAVARWRRGLPTDDDGELTISELPETPRLPRHPPTLAGTDTKKLALSAAPAPAPAAGAGAAAAAVTMISETVYPDLSDEKRQLAAAAGQESAGRTGAESPDPSAQQQQQQQAAVYPSLSEEHRQEVAETETDGAQEQQKGQKERLAAQLGVGGRPGSPSAPVSTEEGDASVALLWGSDRGDAAGGAVCRSVSAAPLLVQCHSNPTGALVASSRLSSLSLGASAATVISVTAYFSATALQAFFSGDAGACPSSASYTVMSTSLPGVGGLVNLVPTVFYAGCVWFLRNSWTRHAASSLLSRDIVWPAPGLEWLLVAYGAQAAVSGLCPGHSPCFTTNTFAVALVAVLTVSRVPTVHPRLPLAATVAGSALVSATDWLTVPVLRPAVAAAAAAAHLLSVGFIYYRLLVPTDIGRLSSFQQLRLLVPIEVGLLAASQLLIALLGAFVLSPAGYLALAGLTTLLTTLWATRQRKGTVSIRTPFSPYAELAQLVGLLCFGVGITLGELAYAGHIGLLEASSIGQLAYLVSCFTLALGVSPRPLH